MTALRPGAEEYKIPMSLALMTRGTTTYPLSAYTETMPARAYGAFLQIRGEVLHQRQLQSGLFTTNGWKAASTPLLNPWLSTAQLPGWTVQCHFAQQKSYILG